MTTLELLRRFEEAQDNESIARADLRRAERAKKRLASKLRRLDGKITEDQRAALKAARAHIMRKPGTTVHTLRGTRLPLALASLVLSRESLVGPQGQLQRAWVVKQEFVQSSVALRMFDDDIRVLTSGAVALVCEAKVVCLHRVRLDGSQEAFPKRSGKPRIP